MPDSRAHDPMQRDWSDAFHTLPLEAPPRDGWQRVAAALPPARVPTRPARWHRPAIAFVATAFFAAVIPLMHWRNTQSPLPPLQRAPDVAATVPASSNTSVPQANEAPPSVVTIPPPITHVPAAPPVAAPRTAAPRTVVPARLDALYTESARLEAVLAHLPDTGAGNVAALAVSADLQDQVGDIDLALSQPALSNATRTALWEERVDTLRQLTGVEATQRWQVARSDESADAAIY